MIRILNIALFLGFAVAATAQNTRLNDPNRVGRWAGFTTLKLSDKWSVNTEYQWRREKFVTNWQQSLLRVGLNYQLVPKVQLRTGYACQ